MFEIRSTFNDKVINVYIPPRHKTICVSLSGGVDSALLLWHILQYQKEVNNKFKIILYTTGGRNRTYFNFYHALKVQQWIFNYTNFNHNYSWCTFKQQQTMTSSMYPHMKAIGKIYRTTLFISGRTSWPPKDKLKPYWEPGELKTTDGNDVTKAEAITFSRQSSDPLMEKLQNSDSDADKWFLPESYFYTPLIPVDKKWVWGSYNYYGIKDLINATRSCEGKQPILNDPCGKCWWCLERSWAIS
jgi:hypothetical protein